MQTKIKRGYQGIPTKQNCSGTASNYINDEKRSKQDIKLALKKEPE